MRVGNSAAAPRQPLLPLRVPTSRVSIFAHVCALTSVYCQSSARWQEVAQSSVEDLLEDRPVNRASLGRGPRAALSNAGLDGASAAEVATWMSEARVDAILASCACSLPSLRSGVRCFIAFVNATTPPGSWQYLPPNIEALLAWSTLFRAAGTFANYVGYLKTACLLAGRPVEVAFAFIGILLASCCNVSARVRRSLSTLR